MTEQVQPRPEMVIPNELDMTSRMALGGLDSVIRADPAQAGTLLQKMIDGVDVRNSPVTDEVVFANTVAIALEASQDGRYLEFDEVTEDRLFTPQAQERAAKVRNATAEKLGEARRVNNLHRLLGYAGCVDSWQHQNPPQQNTPSVA